MVKQGVVNFFLYTNLLREASLFCVLNFRAKLIYFVYSTFAKLELTLLFLCTDLSCEAILFCVPNFRDARFILCTKLSRNFFFCVLNFRETIIDIIVFCVLNFRAELDWFLCTKLSRGEIFLCTKLLRGAQKQIFCVINFGAEHFGTKDEI